MKTIALAALVVALAGPAWAVDPLLAIELCRRMGGTFCTMKHLPEDQAVNLALVILKGCEASDMAARLGIKPNAAWLAEHPGWTRENEVKVCAADRAYIKQRWGYQ